MPAEHCDLHMTIREPTGFKGRFIGQSWSKHSEREKVSSDDATF
jgi:hypothetical protein